MRGIFYLSDDPGEGGGLYILFKQTIVHAAVILAHIQPDSSPDDQRDGSLIGQVDNTCG